MCSKKASDAKSSHVLDFMLEESGGTTDEDLPAGPKRCVKCFDTTDTIGLCNSMGIWLVK